ncbi:MAG: DUF222 domain-containing protein [Acidimicrobiales bacterium]
MSEAEVKAWLGDVRLAQRSLDGLVMGLADRTDRLASDGESAPSDETMRGDGSVSAAQARRESKRAATARIVPGLAEAVSAGAVSGEHVDAIARHTSRLTEEQRLQVDFEGLLAPAAALPVETFGRLVKRTIAQAVPADPLADTQAKQDASEFRHWFDEKAGVGKFCGSLDPERYEALTTAVDQRTASIAASSESTVAKSANLSAQALVELVVGSGVAASAVDGAARGRLPSITVVVDHQTLLAGPHVGGFCQTGNGHDIAPESLARLCCDAVLRRVTLDESGVPINVGRKCRTATDAQWAAIKAVHANCAWNGCTAPVSWCQAHHIREWEQGGPTDLDNLVPLCSQHHHRVHEGQWSIKLLPDRSLKIYKPGGAHHATVPTPSRC